MLIIKVFGGLGNQMFQYAFYRYLKSVNTDVYLDLSDFKVHKHHQGFELQKVFQLEYNVAEKKQIKQLSLNHNNIFYRIIDKLTDIRIVKKTEFNETFHGAFIENGTYYKDIYFNGFWQNAFYAETVKNTLIKDFIFYYDLTGKNLKLIQQLKKFNTISIHFRFGDYLKNDSLGNICDKRYYQEAISIMKGKYTKCKFVVFSDNLDLVKELNILPENSIWVDWNKEKDSYIDMQLMSLCNHNIIANSSFSWWGAWLNQNNNKTVIMPRKWYNTQNINQLALKNWIQL